MDIIVTWNPNKGYWIAATRCKDAHDGWWLGYGNTSWQAIRGLIEDMGKPEFTVEDWRESILRSDY